MNDHGLSALGRRTAAPAISWLMSLTLGRAQLISLAAGFTDNQSLPVRETASILSALLRQPEQGQPALQYGSTAGDPALRELTCERLARMDKAADKRTYDPEKMLITHGSQQFLYMVSEALCDEGDIVLVEDPTYFVFLGILQSHGVRTRGIPPAEGGISIPALRETLESMKLSGDLKRLKLLYLVTYYQNPTGRTCSLENKEAALTLLREYEKDAGHPIYLLEDAAYRELRFKGEDVPGLLSLGDSALERVIYAGTFSKPFATGIRVGFGIAPEPLNTVLRRIKGNHDFGTANLLQQILVRALRAGEYDAHLTVLRARYSTKAALMERAIRQHFPPFVQWESAQGGLYYWARLPEGASTGPDSSFFKSAMEADVIYVPGALCYCEDPGRKVPDTEMRLSFGGAREDQIPEGIRRLGLVMRGM